MRPINHVVFFGLQNGDPQSTLMMSHITLRCLFKFLSVFSWERHWRGNEMIESFLSGQAQAEAQGADLIDNASGGRIHQGPHPFHAWNRHLCMKVHVACGSGPVARLNRLSDYSGSGHGDKGSPAGIIPAHFQTKGWNIHEAPFPQWQIQHCLVMGATPPPRPFLFLLHSTPPPAHILISVGPLDGRFRWKPEPSVEWLPNGLLQRKHWHFPLFVVPLTFGNITD